MYADSKDFPEEIWTTLGDIPVSSHGRYQGRHKKRTFGHENKAGYIYNVPTPWQK